MKLINLQQWVYQTNAAVSTMIEQTKRPVGYFHLGGRSIEVEYMPGAPFVQITLGDRVVDTYAPYDGEFFESLTAAIAGDVVVIRDGDQKELYRFTAAPMVSDDDLDQAVETYCQVMGIDIWDGLEWFKAHTAFDPGILGISSEASAAE